MAFLPGWLAMFALAGCFNPKVKDGGFACSPLDPQPCPSGFYCVAHRCVDHPGTPSTGGNGGDDMAAASTDMTAPPAAGDMSQAAVDMASAPDMAKAPPPDMAQQSTCAHDKCKTGKALDDTCDPCVTQICDQDPTCCGFFFGTWDSICVGYVSDICGLTCP